MSEGYGLTNMKKFQSVLLVAMASFLLCACTTQERQATSPSSVNATSSTEESSASFIDATTTESEKPISTTTVDPTTESSEEKELSLYERYLRNEVKSSIEPVKDCSNLNEMQDWPDDGFTVNELCKFLFENSFRYGDYNEPLRVMYSYIDCAHDGEEELVLQIESGLYDFQPILIYKVVNGSLEMTELFYCYSRGWHTVYQYGYVVGFGSSGAGTHHEYTGVLDENGKYQQISISELSQTHYGDPGYWDNTGRFEKLYEYISSAGYEYGGYQFDAIVRTEFVETGEVTYSFYMDRQVNEQEWEQATDPDIYENSQFAKAFKIAGIELTSKLELDEKLDSFVKEDVRNGGEIQWKELDIDM